MSYSENDWRDYLMHKEPAKWKWLPGGRNTPEYNEWYYQNHKEQWKKYKQNQKRKDILNATPEDMKRINGREKVYGEGDGKAVKGDQPVPWEIYELRLPDYQELTYNPEKDIYEFPKENKSKKGSFLSGAKDSVRRKLDFVRDSKFAYDEYVGTHPNASKKELENVFNQIKRNFEREFDVDLSNVSFDDIKQPEPKKVDGPSWG